MAFVTPVSDGSTIVNYKNRDDHLLVNRLNARSIETIKGLVIDQQLNHVTESLTNKGTIWVKSATVAGNPNSLWYTDNADVNHPIVGSAIPTLTGLTVGTNVGLGVGALVAPTFSGTGDTGIGANALAANTTGTDDTATGNGALAANTTGANNTADGFNALNANVTGSSNTAMGAGALPLSTVSSNTAVGAAAGPLVSNGGFNSLLGAGVAPLLTTGPSNVVIGNAAAPALTTGSSNVLVGSSAGSVLATGSNNTALGTGTIINGAALTNASAIGNGASVGASNYMVFGNGTATGQVVAAAFTGPTTAIGSQNAITNATGTSALTAANVSVGVFTATGAGTYTITLDSTINLINELFGGVAGTATAPLGSIFRLTCNNSATGAITLAAGDTGTIFSPAGAALTGAGTGTTPVGRTYFIRLNAASGVGALVIA